MSAKILAVDDSATMRALISSTLMNAGFEVTVAEDGKDGLEQFEDYRPDLVITDLNMPVLDGFGMLEGVRNHASRGTVPVLFLTTESSDALKLKARRAGATGWIVKPFDAAKLVAAVGRLAS